MISVICLLDAQVKLFGGGGGGNLGHSEVLYVKNEIYCTNLIENDFNHVL